MMPMTQPQAQALLKKLIQAKDKEDLQKIVSANISQCDSTFFAELNRTVAQYRAKNDESSASKLKELGDFMARLRFMI